MSRMSTEQWERKKRYLIRSLFEDELRLSPIPERQEPSLGSTSPVPTHEVISRPFSPLPDLIIEKEPNRHDEPEEFYQELERYIMKLYRKLFLDSENSPQYSDSQNNDEVNNSISQYIHPHFSDSKNNEEGTSSSERTSSKEQSHEEISNEIMNKTKSIEKSIDTPVESNVTSESHTNDITSNYIIVTQALVHHAARKESDKDSRHRSVSRLLNISSEIQNQSATNSSPPNTENSAEQSEDENMQTEFEGLRISNNEVLSRSKDEELMLLIRSDSDPSSSPEEPEMMRRRETSNDSVQSINALDVGRYLSPSFSNGERFKNTDVREMEKAKESSFESSPILGITSTPKIVRREDKKRRISLEMNSHQRRSSLKRKKLENFATQTSLSSSENEDNWSEIQKNFFKGNHRIYHLCSCRNHNCH